MTRLTAGFLNTDLPTDSSGKFFDLPVAETVDHVIVDHAGGLHVGVDDGGADEVESPLFQVL